MATLDFKELDKKPPGEALEALVRLIGERLGMIVQWSGRGADGGRDLFFIETQHGALGTRTIKWLVNCKDHSESQASVSEREIGSVLDKAAQHKCEGFLLATTTTVSTGLKERLDQLDLAAGGKIHTKVWDRFELTRLLGQEHFEDIRRQFFPKQVAQVAALTIDASREVIESSLPRVAAGIVRRHLVPFADRLARLEGARVWSYDDDQRRLIDVLKTYAIRRSGTYAIRRSGIKRATVEIQKLHFDAFVAFVDALIRNFPSEARLLLSAVAAQAEDSGLVFNAIEILREFDGFALAEEIEITRKRDPETLHELYHDFISEVLTDTSLFASRLPAAVERFDDKVALEGVRVREIAFSGGEAVSFGANVDLSVEGWSFDPEEPPAGRSTFACSVEGYLTDEGIEIESVAYG